MKIHDLKVYLDSFDEDDELVIEVVETASGKIIDSTADIVYSVDNSAPTLRIDVEAGKFQGINEHLRLCFFSESNNFSKEDIFMDCLLLKTVFVNKVAICPLL